VSGKIVKTEETGSVAQPETLEKENMLPAMSMLWNSAANGQRQQQADDGADNTQRNTSSETSQGRNVRGDSANNHSREIKGSERVGTNLFAQLIEQRGAPPEVEAKLKADTFVNLYAENKDMKTDINAQMSEMPEEIADRISGAAGDLNAQAGKNGNAFKGIIPEMGNEDVKPVHKDGKYSFKENEYLPFTKTDQFENMLSVEQGPKTVEKGVFGSMIADRIEKIVEQNAMKNTPMDMVMRLKIDDKESLLIGLKSEGQKVFVEVKAGSESMMNLLQANKEAITRNLETKNVYANIFVNPDGYGGFERREGRRENRQDTAEENVKNDFIEFLEAEA